MTDRKENVAIVGENVKTAALFFDKVAYVFDDQEIPEVIKCPVDLDIKDHNLESEIKYVQKKKEEYTQLPVDTSDDMRNFLGELLNAHFKSKSPEELAASRINQRILDVSKSDLANSCNLIPLYFKNYIKNYRKSFFELVIEDTYKKKRKA